MCRPAIRDGATPAEVRDQVLEVLETFPGAWGAYMIRYLGAMGHRGQALYLEVIDRMVGRGELVRVPDRVHGFDRYGLAEGEGVRRG